MELELFGYVPDWKLLGEIAVIATILGFIITVVLIVVGRIRRGKEEK